jgi:Predicted integral membrane protein
VLDCYIVRDLLPNYVEKMVTDETSQDIECHLEHCPNCNALYEELATPVLPLPDDENVAELDFFRKIKRHNLWTSVRNIGIVVAVCIVAFFAFVVGIPVNSDEISIETKIIDDYEDNVYSDDLPEGYESFDGKTVWSFMAKFIEDNNASMYQTVKDIYSDELDENGNKVLIGTVLTLRKRLSIGGQTTSYGYSSLLSDLEGETIALYYAGSADISENKK